jgi:hypothetical protein
MSVTRAAGGMFIHPQKRDAYEMAQIAGVLRSETYRELVRISQKRQS